MLAAKTRTEVASQAGRADDAMPIELSTSAATSTVVKVRTMSSSSVFLRGLAVKHDLDQKIIREHSVTIKLRESRINPALERAPLMEWLQLIVIVISDTRHTVAGA
jgi:hypothetical protein